MHALNIIFGLIGVAGLILIGIGRWMLVSQVTGMSTFWIIAARLPMSEVLILSRFWDTAKNGAFTSLVGMMLVIPWGALQMYGAKDEPHESRAAMLDMDSKSAIYGSMRMHHLAAIEAKDAKFKKLTEYMAAWYASLESRRAHVATAPPEQLSKFNEEAAAYAALRDVTKEELAELTALRAKHYDFGDIKNEDFDAWLKAQDEAGRRYARKASQSGKTFLPNNR